MEEGLFLRWIALQRRHVPAGDMKSPARVVAHSTNAAPALPISCTCGHRRDTEPAHPGAPGTNHPPQYGHPVTPGATRSPVESNPRGVYFWLRGIPKPYVKNRSTVWESRTRNVLCSRTFQIISSSPLSRNSPPHSRQRSILTPPYSISSRFDPHFWQHIQCRSSSWAWRFSSRSPIQVLPHFLDQPHLALIEILRLIPPLAQRLERIALLFFHHCFPFPARSTRPFSTTWQSCDANYPVGSNPRLLQTR